LHLQAMKVATKVTVDMFEVWVLFLLSIYYNFIKYNIFNYSGFVLISALGD
jgi:hypothetical protein